MGMMMRGRGRGRRRGVMRGLALGGDKLFFRYCFPYIYTRRNLFSPGGKRIKSKGRGRKRNRNSD